MLFVSYKLCEHVVCVMQKGSVAAVLYLQLLLLLLLLL